MTVSLVSRRDTSPVGHDEPPPPKLLLLNTSDHKFRVGSDVEYTNSPTGWRDRRGAFNFRRGACHEDFEMLAPFTSCQRSGKTSQ